VAVLAELRTRNGMGMMRRPKALKWAAKHDLVVTTVAALAEWQREQEACSPLPVPRPAPAPALPASEFDALRAALAANQHVLEQLVNTLRPVPGAADDTRELARCALTLTLSNGRVTPGWQLACFGAPAAPHRVLLYGQVAQAAQPSLSASGEIWAAEDDAVVVRIHSDCWWGDALGSAHCDCGAQLQAALQRIVDVGAGVLIFPAGHEGRGIGIVAKTQAYAAAQAAGSAALDTFAANEAVGHPPDARDYRAAARILVALGVRRVHLLTANPDKVAALEDLVVTVSPLEVGVTPHNAAYVQQKKQRHAAASPPVRRAADA
jgi:GTP cyclohydrolase II